MISVPYRLSALDKVGSNEVGHNSEEVLNSLDGHILLNWSIRENL
jgi:hypothetical protein